MKYKAEMDYLMKVLRKLHFQAMCVTPEDMQSKCLDFGLRKFLGMDVRYGDMFNHPEKWMNDNIIYKMTDEFKCRYVFFKLPGENVAFMAGPYITEEKTREDLLEEAEHYNVPARKFRQLEACYANIPYVPDETVLFVMLNAFGEILWGAGNAFTVTEIEYETNSAAMPPERDDETRDPEEIMLHMKSMEDRYAYENELMEAVSQGLAHRAELMLRSFTKGMMEQRVKDPVRNVKNYCIICNTLMRKAAEKGGVHPLHLDSASSMLARRIEGVASINDGWDLMKDSAQVYCRLVKKYSAKQYAPFVRKTVAYIESDLSGDLSLHALAALQNINASYLSTLFHKETGKTITEFVNEKRMELASRLLRTTQLQIQTVAQHCGMSDVNYFSKIFKKFHGVTPKQYREENRHYVTK
ncbi:MAG: helix-turn-helix domain-containing protein [Oscillospiraceae bacterium]|nr:helix-turn-helix domain-containing protein [Oscillospiraceae bacterium]